MIRFRKVLFHPGYQISRDICFFLQIGVKRVVGMNQLQGARTTDGRDIHEVRISAVAQQDTTLNLEPPLENSGDPRPYLGMAYDALALIRGLSEAIQGVELGRGQY
jgi:hypothetical protein